MNAFFFCFQYDDPLLAAWLTFEKKVSIYQTKAIRYKPIIEVTEVSVFFNDLKT